MQPVHIHTCTEHNAGPPYNYRKNTVLNFPDSHIIIVGNHTVSYSQALYTYMYTQL